MKIVLGARKSRLSMAQAIEVMRELRQASPGLSFEVMGFDTPGDRDKKASLLKMGRNDFFTRDLDRALLNGRIDMAVHSAKDLPEKIPHGLKVAAITGGVDSRDVLVLRGAGSGPVKFAAQITGQRVRDARAVFKKLKPGAKIGISSIRRREQVLAMAPYLKTADIRGTIDERLKMLDEGRYDGLILAAAGLIRLGLKNRIAAYLPFETAAMQGRLAVLTRENDAENTEKAGTIDARKKWGTVYIAGAGPGNPELMTVKAKRLIESADALVYDSLAKAAAAGSKAKIKISAGKRKGSHEMEQDEINRKLSELAQKGHDVVRLKGGDPCIFGRGHEEAGYLRERFIKYEIVPGVTAASAAACCAEIPLTLRGVSSSVMFGTGHPENSAVIPGRDYEGTVVYYMAASNARKIAQKLIGAGWDRDMPAAVVSAASLPGQRAICGTLRSFAGSRQEYSSPALFIAGNAAAKGPEKSWFEQRKKILFTGTVPDKYRHLGDITHAQMIELVPCGAVKYLKKIKNYSHVIFTSRHGVRYFFEGLAKAGLDARALAAAKICSIGSVTTDELKKYGIRPDLQPFFESADGLVKLLAQKKIRKANIMIPRSNLAHDTLPLALKKAGHRVDTPVIYRNVMPKGLKPGDLKKFDAVVFTSPSTVRNFKKTCGRLPAGIEVITTGSITMEAVKNEKVQAV